MSDPSRKLRLNSRQSAAIVCALWVVACGGDETTAKSKQPPAASASDEAKFSFFVISYAALTKLSGSEKGFGGNLGGISGADDLCRKAAEAACDCAKGKTWRAFLSTTKEDAIDRIGEGPWYDRVGRLIAKTKDDLLNDRPAGANDEIVDDLPNEFGVPNQYANGDSEAIDNHQTLTGTGIDGRLYIQGTQSSVPGIGGGSTHCDGGWTPEKATCWDWTSSEPEGCPRVGHSWPNSFSGVNWISVWNEGGCAPGTNLVQTGGPNGDPTVGSAGGYGGFYCFALDK
jgi:hypothetical protein